MLNAPYGDASIVLAITLPRHQHRSTLRLAKSRYYRGAREWMEKSFYRHYAPNTWQLSLAGQW